MSRPEVPTVRPGHHIDHWYRCDGPGDETCGRWFGIDYRDPWTGETLQQHRHGPIQLELFAGTAS